MIGRPRSWVAAVVAAVIAVGAVSVAWWIGRRSDRSIEADSIVLVGDSITAQGDWESLLSEFPVVAEGHPGFTSEQLVPVARQVAEHRPRAVVVLAGTNDRRDGRPADWTIRHLDAIVQSFVELSPGTDVVLATVLPRDDDPDMVVDVNRRIGELAETNGVELVDLHAALVSNGGRLRPTDTTDGVHLTPAGYRRLAAALRPTIADVHRRDR